MQKDQNKMVSDAGRASDKIRKELMKRIISLCVTLTVAVLAVVAYLSQAWFASNDTVAADDMDIFASEKFGFELKTEGEEINNDLKGYLDNSILSWKLTADSNLQNHGDQHGIAPGACGNLSFYVIPRVDGSLSIDCTLDIQPVMTGEDADQDSMAAKKLLQGHLLFVCKYTCMDTTTQMLVDVRDGNFQINLPENMKANQEQKITLYWFWPYTLNDANNHETYGSEISAMTNNQAYFDYFFYDSTGSVNVQSDFRILNHHYNEADQMIGDNVEAVVLELTADLAS